MQVNLIWIMLTLSFHWLISQISINRSNPAEWWSEDVFHFNFFLRGKKKKIYIIIILHHQSMKWSIVWLQQRSSTPHCSSRLNLIRTNFENLVNTATLHKCVKFSIITPTGGRYTSVSTWNSCNSVALKNMTLDTWVLHEHVRNILKHGTDRPPCSH